MDYKTDTICAISTPPGTAGIAVIRVSGPQAISAVDHIFQGKRPLKELSSHKVVYGRIVDEVEIIDEVCVSIFRNPHSYTGEDVVEISCHGNTFIANRILELLLRKLRLAEPGEFTQRAFFNNKLDLTQVEAVGDLLQARTKKSHRAAMEQLRGSLHKKITALLERITALRIQFELEIDFPEQDNELNDLNELVQNFREIERDLSELAKTGDEGMILKEGLKICLVGAPNVGKSSIFNAFLDSERAIVTPEPGTTRDYLEEAISLNGYLIRIFDTAGIREAADQIEEMGIKKSYDIIKNSHKILFITDGKENQEELQNLMKIVDPQKIIKVLNKSDLFSATEITFLKKKGFIPCSTIQPAGLIELKNFILKEIEISDEELHSGILTNVRQISAVKKALTALQKATKSLNDNLGPEFTAFDLKEASVALEEIIGLISTDDILNRIFADFCIGK
jgi:tRNA modification GTPase